MHVKTDPTAGVVIDVWPSPTGSAAESTRAPDQELSIAAVDAPGASGIGAPDVLGVIDELGAVVVPADAELVPAVDPPGDPVVMPTDGPAVAVLEVGVVQAPSISATPARVRTRNFMSAP